MEQYIFLHGLGQTPADWEKVICNLPVENVLCPNLFEACGRASYEMLLKQFEEQFASYEVLHLCGISLGAVLALHYAIKHPGQVKSLVLIAPQYKMPKALLSIQNVIFWCMPNAAFQSMGVKKKDMIAMSNSMKKINLQQELQYVSCPVIILCGKKDKANIKAALSLHTKIKQARIFLVENAGHELNVEQPEKTAELIMSFYKALAIKPKICYIINTKKEQPPTRGLAN